jgi:hypothetical protein
MNIKYFYLCLCVCVCVCEYIYIYIYIYIHAYMHTCMHAFMHAFIHTYVHTCTHIHTHTYIHTYISIYIYTYVYTSIHPYTHTHTHTHTHIQGLCEQHLRDSESGLEIECDLRELFAELLEIPLDSFNEQTGGIPRRLFALMLSRYRKKNAKIASECAIAEDEEEEVLSR